MIVEFATRDILTAFFRQRVKFISVFLVVLLVGLAYLVLAQPSYKASGSMLVRFGKEATPNLSSEQRWSSGDPGKDVRTEIVESNLKILKSRSLLESVLKEIGIENVYPSLAKINDKNLQMDYAIRILGSDLDTRAGAKDAIIQISMFNKDPKIAAKFVSRLMDLFIVRQAEVYNRPETAFLTEQVNAAKLRLDESKQKLSDFKAEKGISNIESELEELFRQKGDASKSAFDAVIEAQKTLSELEAQRAKMRATYRADSPVMKRLQISLNEAKLQLEARQQELTTSQDADNSMSMQMNTINQRISYLESLTSSYNELTQQVEIDTENYKNYVQRNEESRITQSLNKENITRITVVDNPTVPSRPERPRKKVVLLVTLLAALMAAVGTALTFEIMDDRFSNARQLSRSLKSPLLAIFNGDIKKAELVRLYGAIENHIKNTPRPIVHFVSAYRDEGSSPLSYGLAQLIAEQSEKNVLYIDTLQNAAHHKLSGSLQSLFKNPEAYVALAPKLSYATLQQDELQLEIFPNGDDVRLLLAHIKEKFDFVIINTDGIISEGLMIPLVSHVDGHVLIVEADRTRSPVIAEVKSLLSSNGGTIIGSILNKRKFYIPTWLYKTLFT